MKLSTNQGDIMPKRFLMRSQKLPTVRDDEERDLVNHDMIEPQMLVDSPKEVSHKRKPTWARELI